MAIARSGYVGAVRLRDGQLHLAASVDQRALQEKQRPAGLIARILKNAHLPIITELHDAPWQGTLPLSRRSAQVASGRVFLIGDAAGYVEPFTGEGMAWAFATGLAAPLFVKRAIEGSHEQAELSWLVCHRQLVRRRQGWCRAIVRLLRNPAVASAAIRCMSFVPAMPQFIVNRLNRSFPVTRWDVA